MTVNANTTTFGGNIGATTPLANLVTDIIGVTRLNSDRHGSVDQQHHVQRQRDRGEQHHLHRSDNMLVRGSINPTVANLFNATFNVANNLNMTNVGATTAFGNITTDAAGNLYLGGTIQAGNNITFGENITLNRGHDGRRNE